MRELPEHLKGPFRVGYYDFRNARVILKDENDEVVKVVAYAGGFTPKGKEVFLKDLDSDRIILSVEPEGKFSRVNFKPETKSETINNFIGRCEERKVPFLEGDVQPVRRWFADTGASVARNFRSLFFDLETHPLVLGFDDEAKKRHRIISCAAYDLEGKSWFFAGEDSSEKSEARVLSSFVDVAKDYDTLLAWNGDNYDFFVLKERAKLLGIPVNWRRWNLLDYLGVTKKLLMSVSDPGLKRSFALDAIGENVLGLRKMKTSVGSGKLHELLKTNRGELEAYNRRDVEIMLALEEKRSFLDLHYALCSLARTFPTHKSLYPSELADGVLLRMGIVEGVHFETRRYNEFRDVSNKFEGAYVMNPKAGFHTEVQVADFASLYPSIIISFNMSPETKLREEKKYPKKTVETAAIAKATGIKFRTDFEGIIPRALRTLIQKRKEYSSLLKDMTVGSDEYRSTNNLSTAVKVVANSFYGLLGSENSRYYDRDIARSVTLTGQYLIRHVIDHFRSAGYETVASDTDSVFVKASPKVMQEMLDSINSGLIPELLAEQRCPAKTVKLDSDKSFGSLLIVTKKRYAGTLALQKGKPAPPGTLEIKGLETQRSDQIRYAQRLQTEFLRLLLDPEKSADEIELQLSQEGDKFFSSDIPVEDIEIMEGLTKYPKDYSGKNAAADVGAWLIQQGEEFFVGMKIPYVVVEHDPHLKAIHTSQYRGHFDRKYYWQNRVLPPVLRLIKARFPDYPFRDFTNPLQLELRWTMPVRRVRMPKKTVEQKMVRFTIPGDKASVREIKTIKKTISAFPGDYRVEVNVLINEHDIVEIETKETISQAGIDLIRRNLKHIEIHESP